MEQLANIKTSINNYNKENNDNVKVVIFSDKFGNNIINIEKNYSWDNKIVKINLKLSTLNINKIYCKVRINDSYISKIEELYKQKYFEHDTYKIIINEFIDKNNQVHKNLESIIFQDNILNVFTNFNIMINNLNSDTTDIFEIDKQVQHPVKNNTPLLPSIESHIKSAVEQVINKTKNEIIEQSIDINISTNESNNDDNNDNNNKTFSSQSPVENELNSNPENEIIENVELKLESSHETVATHSAELEPKLPIQLKTLQPYFNNLHIGINRNVNPYMLMQQQTYGHTTHFLQQPQTLFNQITPATLDAEYNHIMMLENHIKMWQHHLEILKKTHEINIKCYNEKVDIQQSGNPVIQ